MGTRNLTKVILNKKVMVAQYGQWDGYPTGQGQTCKDFILKDGNIKKLKESLSKVRFYDKDKDKKYLEEYDKNSPEWSSDPDNRTREQLYWFKNFISRDIGAGILQNIIDTPNSEILLKDSSDFFDDSLFCEWAYEIDLDTETFRIYNPASLLKSITFKQLKDFDLEKYEKSLEEE